MSPVIIYGVPGSPYVRMPILACEEKGVPWRLQPLAMGEAKSPAYLARQPFGRIPAIEHDDFQLYEAQAILRYIDQAFEGPSLTPSAPRAAARMNQVMNIVDWYVMPSLTSGIGWNRIVAPMFGLPVDEAAVANAIPLGRTCLRALEEILADKPFFAGDSVSLADLAAIAHLDFTQASPEGGELIAGSPLLGWIERMQDRPSYQASTMERLQSLAAAAA
jgi:glutathione S-transferase